MDKFNINLKQILLVLLIFPLQVILQNQKGYKLLIDVDDIWVVPENSKVNKEVKKINLVKKISRLNYMYTLIICEPYKIEMGNPFSVDRSTGSVKLVQSFEGKVSSYVTNV